MKAKTFLFASLFPLALFAAKGKPAAKPMAEQIENKAFDAKKVPIIDEAKPSEKFSGPEWRKASAEKPPACTTGAVWVLDMPTTIEATATKEKTVGVKGKFSRFVGYGKESGEALVGAGSLDLSSWDSGLPPRDYRVMKYVFNVEQKGATVLPFKVRIDTWAPSRGTWESPVGLEFKFRGIPVKQTFAAHLNADGDTVHITSGEPERFTFLNTAGLPGFQKLMSLCNHQFLASYANVAFDATFKKACPAAAP